MLCNNSVNSSTLERSARMVKQQSRFNVVDFMEVIQKEYSFKTPFESGVKIKSMPLAVSVNLYFSQFFLKSVLQWCWEFYLRFSNIKLTKRWNLSKNVTNKNMKVSEKR